jgi:hypothetical protein
VTVISRFWICSIGRVISEDPRPTRTAGAGGPYGLDARTHRARRSAGVDKGVDVKTGGGDVNLERVNRPGRAVTQRAFPAFGDEIGDDDLGLPRTPLPPARR